VRRSVIKSESDGLSGAHNLLAIISLPTGNAQSSAKALKAAGAAQDNARPFLVAGHTAITRCELDSPKVYLPWAVKTN
jgi:hypothetical protein